MSLWWQHTPKQSLSDPKALCHDNSLAVMTTVAIECVLLIMDWGLERQKACRLHRGMDAAHKRSAYSAVHPQVHTRARSTRTRHALDSRATRSSAIITHAP